MKIRWEESVPKFGYLRLHLQDGTTRDATTEDLLRACKASELVVVSAKHVEDMQKLKRECSEPASKADSSRATLCKALDRCSDYEKQAQELRGVLGGDPAGESLIDAARRVVTERVRRERCLIARAVAANIDVRVAEDQGGGFLVAAHRAGEDEDVERNVPAAEVPAELARMLSEVGA